MLHIKETNLNSESPKRKRHDKGTVIGYAALNRDRDPMAWYVRDLFADKMIEAHFTLLFMDWDVGPSFLENISGYIWKGSVDISKRRMNN